MASSTPYEPPSAGRLPLIHFRLHDCHSCSIGTTWISSLDLVNSGRGYCFASMSAMMARLWRGCRLGWLAIESAVRLVADKVGSWFSALLLRRIIEPPNPSELGIGLAQILRSIMTMLLPRKCPIHETRGVSIVFPSICI